MLTPTLTFIPPWQMSFKSEKEGKDATTVNTVDVLAHNDASNITTLRHADDALLAELGYKSEFKREFSVGYLIVTREFLTINILIYSS